MEFAMRAISWLGTGYLLYLQFQPRYRLGPDTVYVADFFLICEDGQFHAVEVKGFEARSWLHKKKLWKKYGHCPLHLVMGGKTVEVIKPEESK